MYVRPAAYGSARRSYLDDCCREAGFRMLAVRLLAEVALLLQRQAARRDKRGNMLARRRGGIERERSNWLAKRLEHGSVVAPIQRAVLEQIGRKVVKGDGTTRCCTGDLAQGALDRPPIQVHRHGFPEEEGWPVR